MTKYLKILCLFAFGAFISSCASDDTNNHLQKIDIDLLAALQAQSPDGKTSYFELPSSKDYNAIPQDPKNPITKAKIVLGGFLFHETALGVDAKDKNAVQTFSCASCHHADAGFQAGTLQGVGEGGKGFGSRGELRKPVAPFATVDVQPVKSPSAMNGAYQPNQLWNGQFGATHLNTGSESNWTPGTPIETNKLGYQGLETQAIAGMGVHRLNISESLIKMGTYKTLFDEAFPHVPESVRYTKEYAGQAIAAYERTLLSNEAPFQKYLKGDINAMNDQEKQGALLFFTKAQCADCHTGPALNSMQFNAIGMKDLVDCPEPTLNTKKDDPANLGRGGFTKNTADNYKFKVPQLYNLTDSPFFGHGSSLRSVKEVIIYKNKAIPENKNVPVSQLDPRFKPLGLTDSEIDALDQFISKSLRDNNLRRYVPQALPSGLCFPNADMQSRIDMDCF